MLIIAAALLLVSLLLSLAALAQLPARWPPAALRDALHARLAALGKTEAKRYRALLLAAALVAAPLAPIGLRAALSQPLNAIAERSLREEHPWLARYPDGSLSLSWNGRMARFIAKPKPVDCGISEGVNMLMRRSSGRWLLVARTPDSLIADCW